MEAEEYLMEPFNLPLPYLQKIHVSECPNLKTLPLGSQSGKHGEDELIIRYTEQEWIDDVVWEDQATKTRFIFMQKGLYFLIFSCLFLKEFFNY